MPPILQQLLTVAVAAACFVGAFFTREDQAISSALVGAGAFTMGLLGPQIGGKK
jgi:hypothetical protein